MQASVAASLMSPTVRASAPSASQMPETVWRIDRDAVGDGRHDERDIGGRLVTTAAACRSARPGASRTGRRRSGRRRAARSARRSGGWRDVRRRRARCRTGTSLSRARRSPPTSTPRIDESTNVVSSRSMITASASRELVQAGAQLGGGGEVVLPRKRDDRTAAVDRRALRCARRPSTLSAPLLGCRVGSAACLTKPISRSDVTSNPHAGIASREACGAAQRRRSAEC